MASIRYQYKYIEADSTWDAVSDSDWGGDGGTDRKGHVVKALYNLQDWWQLSGTVFKSEKISNRTGGHNINSVIGEDLLRVQLDSIFKF